MKYTTKRNRSFIGEDIPLIPSLTVYDEDDMVDTGLVDERGNNLYRVNEKVEFGYKR